MTFLFNDEIISVLMQTEFGQNLTKSAQQKADAARALAISLGNKTLNYINTLKEQPDADIFVRDLTDLLAFINFLYKTNQRYKQKLIAMHPNRNNTENLDQTLYVPYKDFFIYKEGLLQYLRNLDAFAHRSNDPNAQTMRPLIKNLITAVNTELNAGFTSIKDMTNNSLQEVQREIKEHGLTPELQAKLESLQKVNYSDSDEQNSSYQKVSDKSNGNIGSHTNNTISEQDVDAFKNALPFQQDDAISPYNMNHFISELNRILIKDYKRGDKAQFLVGSMWGQLQSLAREIYSQYSVWQSFISTKTPKLEIDPGESGAQAMRDKVMYSLTGYGNDGLIRQFGNKQNAKQAAQRLSEMIDRTRYALSAIKQSPKLTNLFGPEIIDHQDQLATRFQNKLDSFANS